MYNSKIGSGLINALETEVMITKLIGKMSESTLRKLIIAPLKPICNRNVPHIANFTINIGKAIYNKDHPFSRDITLISNDNIQRTAHSFVIAGVSPMVCSAITNFAPSNDKTFKLDCSVDLVDWFIEGAYKSSFVFDEKIDHEDGLNLLNYLLVINKVVVISELRSKLNIELSVN
ncbi:hypothetical protein D5b_00219 [Faustovirus]|nr:hypothetical protein D5b_00219 [Faustovirus]AMN84695.1 hypothetical protein D6_00292 [Faustovirus]